MGVWKDGWISWLVDFVARTRTVVGWADMAANLQRESCLKLQVVKHHDRDRPFKNNDGCDCCSKKNDGCGSSFKSNNGCDRSFEDTEGCDCSFEDNEVCDCSFEDTEGCDCSFEDNGGL